MSLPKCFLEGKVAIVTGASAGIGRCIARRLALAGVNAVLAARRSEPLAMARDELIEQTGVKVLAVPCDVGRLADLQRLVQCTLEAFGRLDIVVNNAGVETFAPFHALTPEQLQSAVQTNLTGALQLTRLAVPVMQSQGWGHVINLSSTAGKYGPPYAAAYAATKAGLIAFTQSLRVEYRSTGIHATAICPGFTLDGGIYERLRAALGRDTPRLIGGTDADRVARAVLRAIRKDQPEVIVNSPPQRPFFALYAAFPRLGEYLFRKFAARYFRRIAELPAIEDSQTVPSHREAA